MVTQIFASPPYQELTNRHKSLLLGITFAVSSYKAELDSPASHLLQLRTTEIHAKHRDFHLAETHCCCLIRQYLCPKKLLTLLQALMKPPAAPGRRSGGDVGCKPCTLFIECHYSFPGMMSPFPRSLEAGHLWQCRPPVLGCAWPKERRPCSLKNLLDGFPHRTKCTGCCSTPASDSYLFADVPEGSGRSGRSCLFNLPAPRSLSLSSCDVAFTLGTLICFENEQDQLPRAVVKRKLENVCENTFLPKCLLFLSHWCLTNVSCSAL